MGVERVVRAGAAHHARDEVDAAQVVQGPAARLVHHNVLAVPVVGGGDGGVVLGVGVHLSVAQAVGAVGEGQLFVVIYHAQQLVVAVVNAAFQHALAAHVHVLGKADARGIFPLGRPAGGASPVVANEHPLACKVAGTVDGIVNVYYRGGIWPVPDECIGCGVVFQLCSSAQGISVYQ